jgi:hypothetical protein
MASGRRSGKRSRDFYWERLRDRPVAGVRLVLGDHPAAGRGPQRPAIDAVELLDGRLPQPDGSLLYDLATRSPLRRPGDRVGLAGIADELAAAGLHWPEVGIDPAAVSARVDELLRAGQLRAEPPGHA